MEASEEILLNSLVNSGVPIPEGVSSVQDLTPPTLFSVCSRALHLIDGPHHASSFPASLPEDSTPDRVQICTDLASAFNNLGFKPDLSFHKFLYPSKEDLYKMVRFLVGKMSESSGALTTALGDEDNVRCTAKVGTRNEEISKKSKHQTLKTQAVKSSYMKSQDYTDHKAVAPNSVLHNAEIRAQESKVEQKDFGPNECSMGDHEDFGPNECSMGDHHSYLSEGTESSMKYAFEHQDGPQNQEEVLKKPVGLKYPNSEHLADERELLNAAVEMLFGGQHTVEFCIQQLNDQVETKRHKLKELESEWNAMEKPLQEKKRDLLQSVSELNPKINGKLMRMKEIDLETESVLAEIKRRDEELSKLSSDLEKQPKLAPRRSYFERINEITKNSRKQDNDVQQILKDTRDLQLESNTVQERLNRTYAVVDETIFREAKKDPAARQVYRLLKNIHESFEQVAEKILAADRSRRDAADYEAKLATISDRSFNTEKLQADLDAIRKENDFLEQRLGDNVNL